MKKLTYLIGEVGQNHNGSMETAFKLIDLIAGNVVDDFDGKSLRGMDAVKFTKRDLKEEMTASAFKQPYRSRHSFGKTYGDHRAFLELNEQQHFELYRYAKARGLDFIETLCSKGCLNLLKLFEPDLIKVASRDLTNFPLLASLAETRIPIILSIGMAENRELDEALEVITPYHSQISILHCLSQYPASYQNLNLKTISYLKSQYPDYSIGYSDHSIGIAAPVAAVALGARIIEKHITLDRTMKGTDHKGSLGPDGIFRMVRDIRNMELALGEEKIELNPSVEAVKRKLARSIASFRIIKKGEVIQENDIHLLSPGDGYSWKEKELVIGAVAKDDIQKDEIIYSHLIHKK